MTNKFMSIVPFGRMFFALTMKKPSSSKRTRRVRWLNVPFAHLLTLRVHDAKMRTAEWAMIACTKRIAEADDLVTTSTDKLKRIGVTAEPFVTVDGQLEMPRLRQGRRRPTRSVGAFTPGGDQTMPRTANPIRFVPTSARTAHATIDFRMQSMTFTRRARWPLTEC